MNPSMPIDKSEASLVHTGRRHMSIAIRIALLSWLVALITLFIFVLITIPQQKKIFLQSLTSKATSVAVSLHDVAAGAAINEDFAGVVSAGQTLLAGDPDLDFLIVIKNDGYSLVSDQKGWRVEPAPDPYWLPQKREPLGCIAFVPMINRRVFHFAQPFDYSGIQWGWIHVGLSLKSYDFSVELLYRNTILLAIGCIVFSLVVSMVHAFRLVRPILRLRHVLQRIAGGDLSVRADVVRHDELGSLAGSVNTMTDALLRRDRMLESVRFAAQQFMEALQWEDVITAVLTKIGQAADVSRAYVFENSTDDRGRLCCSLKYEWVAQGVSPQVNNPYLKVSPYSESGFGRWSAILGRNEIISGSLSEMIPSERAILEPQEIRALIVIPIFVESTWWGFIGLDDCTQDRVFTDVEHDILRAGADMLGATIARQRVQEALLETKATLEQRVRARTGELQNQIIAKEKALAELAETQSSLLEMSRASGMAEVATGVLHNVGNVLNSVNVSCNLLMDQLRNSRVSKVSQLAGLITESGENLAHFLSKDPRGLKIPSYLTSLGTVLRQEQEIMLREAELLYGRIEHIKEIVTMQQNYGRVSGVKESISPEQLMEDALKLNAGALARHEITIVRQYQPVPPIMADKHRVLQILLNLINNAKHACTDGNGMKKIITLRIFCPSPKRVRMEVADNGIGILPENLTRIFHHGFTTRKSGHGFGLHSGALAARELGGSLTVYSEGIRSGATFTLELLCNTENGTGKI